MTLAEFLDKLEQTPRDWFVDEWGDTIRRWHTRSRSVYACPLDAVPGTREAMTDEDRRAVMRAADRSSRHDPELRVALLQRTGLAEPEAQR